MTVVTCWWFAGRSGTQRHGHGSGGGCPLLALAEQLQGNVVPGPQTWVIALSAWEFDQSLSVDGLACEFGWLSVAAARPEALVLMAPNGPPWPQSAGALSLCRS